MVITIDGPAGTGKSSVASQVARRLGWYFLDTGAMYRAVGLAALRRGIDLTNEREMSFVASHARVAFDWTRNPPAILLNDEPVGHLLRGGEATSAASFVAKVSSIRTQLVQQQRQIGAERKNLVTEGRDQGSVVFPDAALKFYLDAAPIERARRRAAQLRARGEIVDMQALLNGIFARDALDKNRPIGALVIPEGAEVVDTTHLTESQVIELIVEKAQSMKSS